MAQKKKDEKQPMDHRDPAFACLIWELEQGDAGYTDGGRWKVEDRSGGEFVFKRKQFMYWWCHRHGFFAVDTDRMKEIRDEYEQHGG